MALWGPIWALPLRVQLPRDLMPTRSVAMPVSWQHRPRDHQSEAWLSEGLQGLLRPGPPPSSLNGGNRRTGTIAPLAVGAGRGDDDRKLRTSRPGRLWQFTLNAAATSDCLG